MVLLVLLLVMGRSPVLRSVAENVAWNWWFTGKIGKKIQGVKKGMKN
ncbi:MAG: hypothetical protein LKF35_06195 [Bifidobacterium minimum]|nr:hypothetical protein [Bifidobacterium minimum]